MIRSCCVALSCLCLVFVSQRAFGATGKVEPLDAANGTYRFQVGDVDKNGHAAIPKTPFANITQAYREDDPKRSPVATTFNEDATEISLRIPADEVAAKPALVLETAENTTQFPDGRIVFSALDAKVHGGRAKLESHPGNHRIGFWSNAADYVTWQYKPSRPGTYDVELTYSGAGNDGTEVEISLGQQKTKATLAATGSWYKYTTIGAGKLRMPERGTQTLTVRCTKKTGGAVMNLKAVTLRPACEGTPPTQAADGTIVCHSRDATIHGVRLRYEPQPKKNTVGYWSNPSDYVSWQFDVKKPGRFDVEILQGCGKGQGGSEVVLSTGDAELAFKVEDTGHFNKFVPRNIGQITLEKAGPTRLVVKPKNKAGVAVMDLRQVKLTPAK